MTHQTDHENTADKAAVTPPPALTTEGRLRARVQTLEEDAERNQGLAKVGARCMREGHQGLIESGRATVEGHRFALSVKLGLGTDATWDAIHERVKELRVDSAEPAAVSAAVAPPTQAADEVDADTVANRAAQVITTMGAEIRELKRERDRYRMAWHNARRRAGVLSAEVTRRAPLLGEYATEIARLRRELAASEGIRENADFHLGQEMARRQRAEKEAAALRRMADETATETQPRRGDAFEQWLKARRDEWAPEGCQPWQILDQTLEEYRLHADTGTPLGEHVCEGKAVGDCECLEHPAAGARQGEPPQPSLRDQHRAAWHALTPDQQAARLAELDAIDEPAAGARQDETPDAQTQPATPMTAHLTTPCDACNHTLNWHSSGETGCTVLRCACARYYHAAGARQDETAADEPECCAHCTHPKRDHDGRADHRAKHSPLVAGDPWCHACNAQCDYAAGARQDGDQS